MTLCTISVRPCMGQACHSALLDRVAKGLSAPLLLTNCLKPFKLLRSVALLSVFFHFVMLTALLNLMALYLLFSLGFAALVFLRMLTPVMSKTLAQ